VADQRWVVRHAEAEDLAHESVLLRARSGACSKP
jgi:hypothetical protein